MFECVVNVACFSGITAAALRDQVKYKDERRNPDSFRREKFVTFELCSVKGNLCLVYSDPIKSEYQMQTVFRIRSASHVSPAASHTEYNSLPRFKM
ncbi:hypothetical protein RRG08_066951 [Elysia crispata]|uniref:Uncharacterized protein n=1 Tax=Elysia crispata TaxID=231223 RepID=A0AAE1AQ64_9GAST|nr:hypothetical protein RRG08_066951 [Elysia crispata]